MGDKIQRLKEEYDFKHSEELFNIVIPSKHQCLIIDLNKDYIKRTKRTLESTLHNRRISKVVRKELNKALDQIAPLKDKIENQRTIVEDLRSRGNAWKELAIFCLTFAASSRTLSMTRANLCNSL